MNRKFSLYWPFLGILFSPLVYLGVLKLPAINLQVISILFGGLLAILLIIPVVNEFKQIKKVKNSGHINDLIYYIRFPLTLAILFILVEFLSQSITVTISSSITLVLVSFYFGLWMVFFLSLIRVVVIVPYLLYER